MIDTNRVVEQLKEHIDKRKFLIPLLLVIFSLIVAWSNRFVQDDAFISFNYAKSLVEGNGLTWFGTRIEGYTNFLWVLWIALGIKLGIDPILWSYIGGLGSFAITIYGTWQISRLIMDAYWPAVVAVLLLSLNYSVSAYATGGLETMLQTALLCWSTHFFFTMVARKTVTKSWVAIFSLLLALAVLTRMDSALPGAFVGCGTLILFYRRRYPWNLYFYLVFPFALIVGAWLVWKISYYGDVLPNTYYAKKDPYVALSGNGIIYIVRFLRWYRLWPFLVLGGIVAIWKKRWINRQVLFLVLLILSWCAYIIGVGGDFMEFRFLIPIAPFFCILLAFLIFYPLGQGLVRKPLLCSVVSLVLIGLASRHYAASFQGITPDKTLDSIPTLATFYSLYPDREWGKIGKRLGKELAETEAVLALSAVGTVPFYSGLKTVDMLGLNDAYIAKNGQLHTDRLPRPGHQRNTNLQYLKEQGVNFIIGHPRIISHKVWVDDLSVVKRWVLARGLDVSYGDSVTVVAMPLDETQVLLMWYLNRSEIIDKLIEEKGWEEIVLVIH